MMRMDARLFVFLFILIDVLSGSRNNELIEAEVCNTDHFKASCEEDEVIIIEHAQYGRYQRGGVCVTDDFGHVGCVLDVMMEAEMACSGRRSCDIRVDDASFREATPCHKALKNHLWIGYRCLAVFKPSSKCTEGEATNVNLFTTPILMPQQQQSHKKQHKPLQRSKNYQASADEYHDSNPSSAASFASPSYHYLSSEVTEVTGCGSRSSPWLLMAGEGQRINLTLYDYSAESLLHYYKSYRPNLSINSSLSARTPSMTCRILATVNENTSRNGALRICAGQGKVHSVYTSTSNQVQLRFLLPSAVFESSNDQEAKHPQPSALGFQFLFKIQVMGCASPPVQAGMRVRRMAHHVVIDCGTDMGPKWELTCINDIWIGNYSNCTQDMLSFSSRLELMFPYATSVVVVAIIASIMVCFILTAGILCIKWRLKQDMVHTHYQTKPFGSRDLIYDFSAINQQSLPMGEERKYRVLPNDGASHYPGGCIENLNEYATMRLLQQEAEGGFRSGNQVYKQSPHHSSQPLSTMVVMAPSTSVAHGNCPYPSNVTTFLSSDNNEAYRSDHIYESPDLVKAEVDKLNMLDKGGQHQTASAYTQEFPSSRSVSYNIEATSPKVAHPKRQNSAQADSVHENRNVGKFQKLSSFEAMRGNQQGSDEFVKKSTFIRDPISKL